MKRKVVKHGPATYIISLPSAWVKKCGIKKGDELEVKEENHALLINSEIKNQTLETNANISNLDRTSIMYAIRGFYRLGYDTINIKFDNPTTTYQRKKEKLSVLSVIHTEVNRLLGYEVMNETEKSCTIKDIQETTGRDFDQIMRRIFLLLIDASESLIEGSKTQNTILLETIENKHDTITKFVSYCMRLLNKHNHSSPRKTSYYYHIIAYLDRVTDIIKYASRDVSRLKTKLSPKILDVFNKISEDLYTFYQVFYKYDNKDIQKINEHRYKIEEEIRKLDVTDAKQIIIAANIAHISEILLDLIEARTALEY